MPLKSFTGITEDRKGKYDRQSFNLVNLITNL